MPRASSIHFFSTKACLLFLGNILNMIFIYHNCLLHQTTHNPSFTLNITRQPLFQERVFKLKALTSETISKTVFFLHAFSFIFWVNIFCLFISVIFLYMFTHVSCHLHYIFVLALPFPLYEITSLQIPSLPFVQCMLPAQQRLATRRDKGQLVVLYIMSFH